MDDLIREFLVESYENLDQLDRDFVALETDPTAQDKLSSIFRTIHTIKGTCGCLGLVKLESVAHVGENLLSKLREGQFTITSEMTTALLRMVDAVREMLGNIEATEKEGIGDYSEVIATLVRVNETPQDSAVAAMSTTLSVDPASEPAVDLHKEIQEPLHTTVHDEHAVEAGVEPVHAAINEGVAKEKSPDSVAGNAIRVDIVLLDKLMNLVGELVLARNQVLQFTASQKDTTFLRNAQRLNLITTELQEGVMKTRMQPIGNLWNKFPRVVRDVANVCGKKIRIEMEGVETELDKTILEAIKDPLMHVIRNSVDHGVETPDRRRAAGKPEEGRLFMRAFHEGGQVIIEITDDGKGIDPEVIKTKALEKGLITAEHAARMGEREAISLIFLPGFSTAEKVTNVSGRGVGMDVVKTNVEKIGGAVDVSSRLGHGSTLRMKIPLTLAIIPALIVTSGGERFAIPQVSLLELLRMDEAETGIELINGTPLYRLRGNLLPLVYLNRELNIERATRPGGIRQAANIVVLRGGDRQFGMVVDEINDTEEIVVKPLGKQLKSITVFAGATIMGDGKVALILDVTGIATKANISHVAEPKRVVDESVRVDQSRRQTLLLFKVEGGQVMAMPLSLVARLEEFPRAKIEDAGGRFVVQYRGQIMPIVSIAEAIGDRRARARSQRIKKTAIETDTIQIIVYSRDGTNIGLRVEQILDVVDEHIDLQPTIARHGVVGTAIIRQRSIELLDVPLIVNNALGRHRKMALGLEAA